MLNKNLEKMLQQAQKSQENVVSPCSLSYEHSDMEKKITQAFFKKLVNYFDFLEGQWKKDKNNHVTEEEALLEIYKRVRPGEPASVEAARAYLRNAFFESRRYDLSRVGRYKLNRKLGPEIKKLEDLFGIELEKPKKIKQF